MTTSTQVNVELGNIVKYFEDFKRNSKMQIEKLAAEEYIRETVSLRKKINEAKTLELTGLTKREQDVLELLKANLAS